MKTKYKLDLIRLLRDKTGKTTGIAKILGGGKKDKMVSILMDNNQVKQLKLIAKHYTGTGRHWGKVLSNLIIDSQAVSGSIDYDKSNSKEYSIRVPIEVYNILCRHKTDQRYTNWLHYIVKNGIDVLSRN